MTKISIFNEIKKLLNIHPDYKRKYQSNIYEYLGNHQDSHRSKSRFNCSNGKG